MFDAHSEMGQRRWNALAPAPERSSDAGKAYASQVGEAGRDRGASSGRRATAPTRAEVRAWLRQFADCRAEFAVEGTTGWRFVVEEVERAGHRAHLADPAETAARRGRKRRAKTDRADCDLQVRLLLAGELPESWIPPAQILELRTLVRLRKTLIDQRSAWQQRIHAQLFHQGVPAGLRLRTPAAREALRRAELSPAGRELVALALRMLDAFDRELARRSTANCAPLPAASPAAAS
jgi:hypothetical protein